MDKIIIVSPNFRREVFLKRWKLLADKHKDFSVILLAPDGWTEGKFKGYTFGKKRVFQGKNYKSDNFEVRTVRVRQDRLGDWSSPDIKDIIKKEQPDFLYVIGNHSQGSMCSILTACKKYSPKTIRMTFTMRDDRNPYTRSYKSLKLKILNLRTMHFYRKNVFLSDVIFCHYPDALNAIVKEGYTKPVYINTQIGLDNEIFYFKPNGRLRVRDRLRLGDSFVFGSATRFNPEKGIIDILHSLPLSGNWKYVILGSGNPDEIELIQSEIKSLGLEDKVIMPGFIEWSELPDYLSALDCVVHVPRTTYNWKETFSIALVQAISVGLPLIGNDSGSVPYQCGPDGIIVREGDLDSLRKEMTEMMNNPAKAKSIGKKQQDFVVGSFGIERITECFYKVLKDIKKGVYDKNKIDTKIN